MAMLGTGLGFFAGLIFAIIGIVVSSILLFITAKIFKLKGSFSTAFMIALIVGIVSYAASFILGFLPIVGGFLAPLISLVLSVYLGITQIKSKYHLDTGKAVLVWLVWFVMSFVLMAVISFIVAALFVGAGLAMGGASMMGLLG